MNKNEIKKELKKNIDLYQTYRPWEIINEYLPFGLVLNSGKIVHVALYGLEKNFLGSIMIFDSMDKFKTYEFIFDYEGKANLLKRAEQYIAQEGIALTREPDFNDDQDRRTDKYDMKLTRYQPYHIPEDTDLKKDLELANNVLEKINQLCFLIHNGVDKIILNKFHPIINGKGLIPIFDLRKNTSNMYITKEVINFKKDKFKRVKFNNELLAAKLKQKMRYGTWAMEFFYSTAPIPKNDTKNSFIFMNGIILIDFSNDYMEPILLQSRIEEDPVSFINEFAQELLDFDKLPAEVLVRDQKTYAILADLFKQLNITVTITEDIPEIEEVETDMYQFENERRTEPEPISLAEINEYIDNLSQYSDSPFTNRLLKNLIALKEDLEHELDEDDDE